MAKRDRPQPLPEQAGADGSTVHVTFLSAEPSAAGLAALRAVASGADEWTHDGWQLYLHTPGGLGRSKLNPGKLGVGATTRNWRTVLRLGELSGAVSRSRAARSRVARRCAAKSVCFTGDQPDLYSVVPAAADRLSRFEASLRQVRLDGSWAANHRVEFDLTGPLNPSVMLDQQFRETGEVPSFEAFSDTYLLRHFQGVKAQYLQLADLKRRGEVKQLKRQMSHFAYAHYRHDLTEGLSDDQLRAGVRARLYRTLCGMYTELHAYLLCAQALGEDKVIRSAALDRAGVDFQLSLAGKVANVHVFRKSARAEAALRAKLSDKGGARLEGLHVCLPYGIHGDLPESTRDLGNGFYIFRDAYLKSFIVAVQCYAGQARVVGYQPAKLTAFDSPETSSN